MLLASPVLLLAVGILGWGRRRVLLLLARQRVRVLLVVVNVDKRILCLSRTSQQKHEQALPASPSPFPTTPVRRQTRPDGLRRSIDQGIDRNAQQPRSGTSSWTECPMLARSG